MEPDLFFIPLMQEDKIILACVSLCHSKLAEAMAHLQDGWLLSGHINVLCHVLQLMEFLSTRYTK